MLRKEMETWSYLGVEENALVLVGALLGDGGGSESALLTVITNKGKGGRE